MDNQLLVRMYNVGLGDLIYLRVPDRRRQVHILIDCGNKFGGLDILEQRLAELKKDLPDAGGGKKRLDLLVVTHPHEDHHKGFEPGFFADIQIERIWLSPAFNRADPQAQGFHALQDTARRALTALSEQALDDPEFQAQLDELLSLSRDEAIETLCHTLPERNGIQPVYVSADTPAEKLAIFKDPKIRLKVLGPMGDIDGYYLGGEMLAPGAAPAAGGAPPGQAQGMAQAYAALFPTGAPAAPGALGAAGPAADGSARPKNISSQDFKRLLGRVRASALAAVEVAGHAVNNLSVILLLEWRGRRLFFPGDAEWREARSIAVEPGRSNGSWNVMWQERRADLSAPLDFLKIGHHGSLNATPWSLLPDGEPHPISVILDALLPLPAPGKQPAAFAVASTRRTARWPSIPDPALMAELGRRVANARREYVEPKKGIHVPDDTPQPQRTDLEGQLTGGEAAWIELRFTPQR